MPAITSNYDDDSDSDASSAVGVRSPPNLNRDSAMTDPPSHGLRKVQHFQEPFVAPLPQRQSPRQSGRERSPSLPSATANPTSPPTADLRRSNTGRSRTTSRAPPTMAQQQPIQDAVNSAFDNSPAAQSQLDPELIRQVTEQVMRNLQGVSVGASPAPFQPPVQQPHPPPPPAPSANANIAHVQPRRHSSQRSSMDSIPPQYTPPSPMKRGQTRVDGYVSTSPEPLYSDNASIHSRESVKSQFSTESNRETPRPVQHDNVPTEEHRPRQHRDSYTGSGRRKDVSSSGDERSRRRAPTGSMPPTHESPRQWRRDSRDPSTAHRPPSSSRRRAKHSASPFDAESGRAGTDEETTLEKIWQPLFENGNPTARLGEFLRGLALHLIDEYEPKGSLVVTPQKMMRFFHETRVAGERYPWETIFGGRMTMASLSVMYRKLLCQHHLVQLQNHELPSVPGLTPHGFEWFVTCLIQAHPDIEFDRLARAVMNMPISNADNKTERFPKELSRRLLPSQPSLQAEQRIVASLAHEPRLVQLRGASSMPPPPPSSAPPQQTSFTERERAPYSQPPHASVTDDEEDPMPPSVPIERERKPYTAKEGAGKVHGGDVDPPTPTRNRESSRPSASQYRHEAASIPRRRNSRSNSGIPAQATYGSTPSDPISIPPPGARSHRTSNPPGPPPAMTNGSVPKPSNRRATPPPRNPFARSEPLEVGSIPNSQYTSNLYPRESFVPNDTEDDHRRYGVSNNINIPTPKPPLQRRPTLTGGSSSNAFADDDLVNANSTRSYPIPPRPPPSTQAGPFVDPAVYGGAAGSYPRGGFSADARRSTWYGAVNTNGTPSSGAPNGGMDGYGSFSNGNGRPTNYTFTPGTPSMQPGLGLGPQH